MCKRSRQSWHRQLLSASSTSHIRWRTPCQNEVGFKTKPYLSLHLYFRFCLTTLLDLCCAEVALDSCSVRLGLPLTNGIANGRAIMDKTCFQVLLNAQLQTRSLVTSLTLRGMAPPALRCVCACCPISTKTSGLRFVSGSFCT